MKVAVLESWALGCKIVLKELTIEIQNPRSTDKESAKNPVQSNLTFTDTH